MKKKKEMLPSVLDKGNTEFSALILANIMANMPGHVYWKDINGVYLGCNDKQARTLGFQFGYEVVGKTDFDLPWPRKSAEEFHENDKRIMLSGIAEAMEEKLDENTFVFSIKSPIKNQDEQVYGILGISIDITEKKQIERLEKEKEIARKHAELMNILSGSMAHEVRTPLSIMKINADLMQMSDILEKIPETDEKQQFLNKMNNIHQAIKECTQVMDMFLIKLRKIATPELDQNTFETCSIMETIQTALFEYPFRNNEKHWVHFKPKQAFDFIYTGQKRLTKHVLFNLLKNALHVIKEAEKGEIFIECKKHEKFNQVIFKDTALGIPKNYLPKIFNKFETTDEANSGTGLGLTFCKLVMESYGGKIECRSEFGHFTEFVLSFPAV